MRFYWVCVQGDHDIEVCIGFELVSVYVVFPDFFFEKLQKYNRYSFDLYDKSFFETSLQLENWKQTFYMTIKICITRQLPVLYLVLFWILDFFIISIVAISKLLKNKFFKSIIIHFSFISLVYSTSPPSGNQVDDLSLVLHTYTVLLGTPLSSAFCYDNWKKLC